MFLIDAIKHYLDKKFLFFTYKIKQDSSFCVKFAGGNKKNIIQKKLE